MTIPAERGADYLATREAASIGRASAIAGFLSAY